MDNIPPNFDFPNGKPDTQLPTKTDLGADPLLSKQEQDDLAAFLNSFDTCEDFTSLFGTTLAKPAMHNPGTGNLYSAYLDR
jgi:hypothetical protein